MQIFISWSGPLSKAIAGTFASWVPTIIQSCKTYYTPNDTEKGSRWFEEIAQQLEASSFGVVVLTPNNLEKPWIHFEAGALISKLERKVSPLLVGVTESDLKPPLSLLNATFFDKDDVRRLLSNVNDELGDKRVSADTLNKTFDKFWPDLQTSVASHIAQENRTGSSKPSSKRDQSEVLEELVSIVRDLQRRPHGAGVTGFSLTTISRQLVSAFAQIAGGLAANADREDCLDVLDRVCDDFFKTVQNAHVDERPILLEQLERVRRSISRAKDEMPF